MTWEYIPHMFAKLQTHRAVLPPFHMAENAIQKYLTAVLLALTLALTSCGGGTYTAGAGGSGIGGTGITTITGNISQVVAEMQRRDNPFVSRRVLAALSRLATTVANAQSGTLAGIQVTGGGRKATTDGSGGFHLEGVTPSDDFVLTFVVATDGPIALPIGTVPAGSHVRVDNVILHTGQGTAAAGDVKVEPNEPANEDARRNNSDDNGTDNGATGQETGNDQSADGPDDQQSTAGTSENDSEGSGASDDGGGSDGSGSSDDGGDSAGGGTDGSGSSGTD